MESRFISSIDLNRKIESWSQTLICLNRKTENLNRVSIPRLTTWIDKLARDSKLGLIRIAKCIPDCKSDLFEQIIKATQLQRTIFKIHETYPSLAFASYKARPFLLATAGRDSKRAALSLRGSVRWQMSRRAALDIINPMGRRCSARGGKQPKVDWTPSERLLLRVYHARGSFLRCRPPLEKKRAIVV